MPAARPQLASWERRLFACAIDALLLLAALVGLYCTLVVKMPPPQAHRAPAVPMFSAGDAEFGVPPRRRG